REKVARDLYDRRHYVMAHYVAGLAVECLLRAYRFRRNPEFDSRHDLLVLCDESGFQEAVGHRKQFRVRSIIQGIAYQWNNAHRFRSDEQFRRYLKQLRVDRGIRGSFVKENTRRIVEAAGEIVALGVRSWPN